MLDVDPAKHSGFVWQLLAMWQRSATKKCFFRTKKKNTSGSARLGSKFNFDLISFIFGFILFLFYILLSFAFILKKKKIDKIKNKITKIIPTNFNIFNGSSRPP